MSIFETKQPELFQESKPSNVGSVQHFGEASFGAGTDIIKIDREGAKFGGYSLVDAQAYIKTDGTYKFKDASGNVLIDSLGTGGNFLNVINENLNTSTKQILGSFSFGASGAITINTDANNGLWISPTGILGKKAGATTFAIDNSGNATFAGTLSAVSGTLGTVTGGVLQTATSGYRIRVNGSNGKIEFLNGDTVLTSLYADSSANMIIDATTNIKFAIGGTAYAFFTSAGLYPNTDKTGAIGSSSKEWNAVYSQDYYSGSSKGTTQTWDFDAGESHRFVFVSGLFISHEKL